MRGELMVNLQFLEENGGASIKLHMINEGLVAKDSYDANELANELLQISKVKTALNYFNQFNDIHSMPKRELYGLVHNCYGNCYEMFMPFLIRLGFMKGIKSFDEKVEPMFDAFRYFITPDKSGELHWSHVYGLIIILNLLRAGYFHDDMLEYMTERIINKVHKVAENNVFDFYETDPLKIRHRPKQWQNAPVIKDIHNCEIGEMPLPTNYHVEGMLYIYQYVTDSTIKKKIDNIMHYILDPRYQKTGGDYGIHWDDIKKTYHASSGGFPLQEYDSENPTGNIRRLEMLSFSPVMRNSKWYKKCLTNIERYKNERGTYICDHFDFISTVPPGNASTFASAFINKDVLANIKRADKKNFAHELCTTLYVAILKKRR